MTFQVTERIVPGTGAGDQRGVLAKLLEDRGFQVLEKSARYLPIAGAYGSQFSAISITADAREPVEVRKHVTFRVTGFKQIGDVLDVLGRRIVP